MVIYKSVLHFNLDFLEPGNVWAPDADKPRYENYRYAREQFELLPEDFMVQLMPGGLLSLQNGYSDFANFTRILAYPRLLTLKTTDMVMGQPPLINAQSKEKYNDAIRDVRADAGLNLAMRTALIDYSRFGVGILRVFKEGKQAKVTAWDPMEWIPVFYPDGTNRIHYNVIGWLFDDKLTVQIHNTENGSYEERVYMCNGSIIGDLQSKKSYNTKTGKNLLFAIVNTPTTTNPLGCNDYFIINSLLQKAIERLMAILRVLDEHADPSMTGPSSLLDKTENGELVFKTSKYYAVGKEELKPEYLVWEANLESSFKAFDELCKQIYILSEMGEAFLGAPNGSSNVVSGTAMRFKMISPLAKARRIQNAFTEPLKNIVSAMMSIAGQELPANEINILWKDSLPKDPREIAELSRLESGSPATKPLVQALIDNYDLDKETADYYEKGVLEFLAKIKEFQKNSNNEVKNEVNPSDKRTEMPTGQTKGSEMDPAASENQGDDEKAGLE